DALESGRSRKTLTAAVAAVSLPFLALGLNGPTVSATTTAGTISTYPGLFAPFGITTGSDGDLWFADGHDSIGRITTAGAVTTYTGTGISSPQQIAAGPDGALWFTNYVNNSIGRITTGGVVSNYTGAGIARPEGIVAGPDGALWFANNTNSSIGRLNHRGE